MLTTTSDCSARSYQLAATRRHLRRPRGMRYLKPWRPATFVLLSVLATPSARAQRPVELAPNAPADRPVSATLRCQLAALKRDIAPLSTAARASFPDARARFERGLPPRHSFFVSTWLHDSAGRQELVFVAVDSITGAREAAQIAGHIWSPVQLVRGYHYRQPYTFAVTDLVDWMIARPDGSEEGNEVGKFMDRYVPPPTCSDSGKAR